MAPQSRGPRYRAMLSALTALHLAASLARAADGSDISVLRGFAGPVGGIPPDPAIAAGPEHLVVLGNGAGDGAGALLTKNGDVIETTFGWGFDTKVVYDPHASRFLTLGLDARFSAGSTLLLHVSRSSTPGNMRTGSSECDAWVRHPIRAGLDHGVAVNQTWADFPSIGFDRWNVYVTANMVPDGGAVPAYAKLWIFPKAALLAGDASTFFEVGAPPGPPLANPVTQARNLTVVATTNLDASAEHLLALPVPGDAGIGRTTLWTVADPGGAPTVLGRDLPLPGWTGWLFPPCPQAGSVPPVDSGLAPNVAAVEHDGRLWAAHTAPDVGITPGRSEIHWYAIDAASGSIVQSGSVSDPVRCYFYPAIQPDGRGNVALVMNGVDASIHPSIFVTGRLADDAAGTMGAIVLLKAGVAPYANVAGDGRNRWGDYGGIAADPVSGEIWTFHEYAGEPANSGRTWVSQLRLGPSRGTAVTDADPPTPANVAHDYVDCSCRTGLEPPECEGETLPIGVRKPYRAVCNIWSKPLPSSPRKQHRRGKKLRALLQRAASVAARASLNGRLSIACASAIEGKLSQLNQDLLTTLP